MAATALAAASVRAQTRALAITRVNVVDVINGGPFAIAEEARRQNLPLAGHVPHALTVEEVVDAGQGDIEHLSNLQLWKPCSGGDEYRPEACRPFFEMLARRSIRQTPALVFWSEVAAIGTATSRISAGPPGVRELVAQRPLGRQSDRDAT